MQENEWIRRNVCECGELDPSIADDGVRNSAQFHIVTHGTRCAVHGTRYTVHRTRYKARGTQYGSRYGICLFLSIYLISVALLPHFHYHFDDGTVQRGWMRRGASTATVISSPSVQRTLYSQRRRGRLAATSCRATGASYHNLTLRRAKPQWIL